MRIVYKNIIELSTSYNSYNFDSIIILYKNFVPIFFIAQQASSAAEVYQYQKAEERRLYPLTCRVQEQHFV